MNQIPQKNQTWSSQPNRCLFFLFLLYRSLLQFFFCSLYESCQSYGLEFSYEDFWGISLSFHAGAHHIDDLDQQNIALLVLTYGFRILSMSSIRWSYTYYNFLHWWLLNCLDLALSAVYYCSRQRVCQQIRSKLSFPKITRKLWRRLMTYISFHRVKILKHASHTWGCGTGMESTILCLRFVFWNLRAFPAAKSHLLLDLDFWSWCYSYPNS